MTMPTKPKKKRSTGHSNAKKCPSTTLPMDKSRLTQLIGKLLESSSEFLAMSDWFTKQSQAVVENHPAHIDYLASRSKLKWALANLATHGFPFSNLSVVNTTPEANHPTLKFSS